MPFEAILREAEQLYDVSKRLVILAGKYPPLSDQLMTISGSVHNTATVLGVLITTKIAKPL
jgi:hypothetical protein